MVAVGSSAGPPRPGACLDCLLRILPSLRPLVAFVLAVGGAGVPIPFCNPAKHCGKSPTAVSVHLHTPDAYRTEEPFLDSALSYAYAGEQIAYTSAHIGWPLPSVVIRSSATPAWSVASSSRSRSGS